MQKRTEINDGNVFDIDEFISCFDDMSKMTNQPIFSERYGIPTDVVINYKSDKGESRIFPLVKDSSIDLLLLARGINDGHFIYRTASLSANEISGTLVSAGVAMLFELSPDDLNYLGDEGLIASKLGNNFIVSKERNLLAIEERVSFEPNGETSGSSKVLDLCNYDELADIYIGWFGIDNTANNSQLVEDAIRSIVPSTGYCYCPLPDLVSEYLGLSGQDWIYDEEYWDNPNLTFPPQQLPTYECFSQNFPRNPDGSFMYGADNVYELAGGDVLQVRENDVEEANAQGRSPRTNNTCALKVSIALNECGINIPYIPGSTIQGEDGGYYFLNAEALNNWMKLTFPAPAFECWQNSSTDVHSEINGDTGIVISMYGPGSGSTGHADIYLGNACSIGPNSGNCAFGGEVCFWSLN